MTDPAFVLREGQDGPIVEGTPGHVLTFQADGKSVRGEPGGSGGGVQTVFGRPGPDVVADPNDYDAQMVTNDTPLTGDFVGDALCLALHGTYTSLHLLVNAAKMTADVTFDGCTGFVRILEAVDDLRQMFVTNASEMAILGGVTGLPVTGDGPPNIGARLDALIIDNVNGLVVQGFRFSGNVQVQDFAKDVSFEGCAFNENGVDFNGLPVDLFNCNVRHPMANTDLARFRSCTFIAAGAGTMSMGALAFDAATEGEYFKAGNALTGKLTALDSSQCGDAQPMADVDTTVDFSGTEWRLVLAASTLTNARALTVNTTGGAAGDVFVVDSYNASGHAVTVNGGLAVIGNGNFRYRFRSTGVAIVLDSLERL